jgi:transposase InsO family protein
VDWPGIVARLEESPELEAKTLFEDLLERHPERYQPGQLRTLQRRVKAWRARHGPPKEIFFPQEHRPGEAAQTDFTWGTKLAVTIGGEPFDHLLCHLVLPYSNWEWATVCRSESLAALRRGVQAALFRLGRVPEWHQTDNSTSATHNLPSRKREFNEQYLVLMRHLGMKPRTIAVGRKEQNGDVESSNGALKRRLEQHLLMRGSRDFESVEAYEHWIWGVLEKSNGLRRERVEEELAAMRPLRVERLPEYVEVGTRVTTWSTIRVAQNTYSVPSRLSRERVRVRLFDDRLEIFHGGEFQLSVERLHGKNGHRINYRHIIWSLMRKPGAFARYRYRDDLFPTNVFRRAYDALARGLETDRAEREYLRILHRAASTLESTVEAALVMLLENDQLPLAERVSELASPPEPEIPDLAVCEVDLETYDILLADTKEVSA